MTLLLLLAGLTRAEDVAVTSNLTGAAILLNGVDTGEVTPATLTGVPPGPIVVSVREGCASGSANVKVVAGQPAKVSLFAIEQGGTLVVKPTPADAIVSVNGKNLKSPGQKLTLDCGEHTVRAEREGYAVTVMTIQVTADDALVLPIELTKADLASLELSVQPRTALLMLDGKEVGTDTVTLPSVKPGTHTIAAEYTGYQSIEQTVSIASGDDVAWHFELVRTATKAKSTATQIRGKKPEATVADLDTDSGDDESLEDADEDTTDDVPYYARDPEAEKAAKAKADADADADADAKAKADARQGEGRRRRQGEEGRRRGGPTRGRGRAQPGRGRRGRVPRRTRTGRPVLPRGRQEEGEGEGDQVHLQRRGKGRLRRLGEAQQDRASGGGRRDHGARRARRRRHRLPLRPGEHRARRVGHQGRRGQGLR